jgi:hypothetical protein
MLWTRNISATYGGQRASLLQWKFIEVRCRLSMKAVMTCIVLEQCVPYDRPLISGMSLSTVLGAIWEMLLAAHSIVIVLVGGASLLLCLLVCCCRMFTP